MKRNKELQEYANQLVIDMMSIDQDNVDLIRKEFNEISLYVKGLVLTIGEENTKPDGETFDYDQFDRKSRGYFSRLNTFITSRYAKISSNSIRTSKDVYYLYRKEFGDVLKSINVNPKTETLNEAINVTFAGTPTQSFKAHLNKQFQAGFEPASLIKTVSPDHLKLIQRQMMTGIAKGKGNGWTVDKIMNNIYPNFEDRLINKQMEQNVSRITRTSFSNAVNADNTDFVSQNSDIFYGNRRVADGRPCLACVAQDGRFYKIGEELIDHPSGMCLMVPMPYPDEFFLTGKLTKPVSDTFDEPLGSKIYKMSVKDQKAIFNNNLLYNLWKKEKFDLDKTVVGKFGTPISYQSAATNLDKMGGISFPRTNFVSTQAKTVLNPLIDPKDRLNGSITVSRKPLSSGVNSYGLDYTDTKPKYMQSKAPNNVKAMVSALYGNTDLTWVQYNERARALNLWTRKDTKGNIYYAMPNYKL